MVLPAVLRNFARHPEQASRRNRARRLNHRAGVYALARYVARAIVKLPPALSAVFVHFLRRSHRARLSRLAGANRWLCDRCAYSHYLLFRILLRDPAAVGAVRENQAVAELDF